MLEHFPQFIADVGSVTKQKEHELRFSKGFYQESPAYDWLSLKKAFKVWELLLEFKHRNWAPRAKEQNWI